MTSHTESNWVVLKFGGTSDSSVSNWKNVAGVVKARLIKNFGYDDESATDVLNFVASIFARGDAKE